MNVAIYHIKNSKRKIRTVELEEVHVEIHEADRDDYEEKLQIFRQHLSNLNLLDKGIIMLYLENKSYEEIAKITGISESNVGTKISRIRQLLKKQITKHL